MEGRSLLVSDVDGTLLGDDAAVAEFAEWYDSARSSLTLAYCSGRLVESLWESIEETQLPRPDAIIGGVGTEILLVEDERRLDAWPSVASWDAEAIRTVCLTFPELESQPDHFQSRYKISFYGHDLTVSMLEELKRLLSAKGFDVEVVYSSSRDLDVLPAKTNKGTAAAFLARQYWNFDDDEVIVSGDTGNDLAMFQQGFRGVVVANARDALKRLKADNVYHSPLRHAAGVIDGVQYWIGKTLVLLK